MGTELIFLVLIAVVLVFGFGVLLVSRARVRRQDQAAVAKPSVTLEDRRRPPTPPSVEEEESEPAVDVLDEHDVLEPFGEGDVGTVVVEERPRFRDRLGKARATLTGALHRRARRARASTPTPGTSWRRRCCVPMSASASPTPCSTTSRPGSKAKEITDPDAAAGAAQGGHEGAAGGLGP